MMVRDITAEPETGGAGADRSRAAAEGAGTARSRASDILSGVLTALYDWDIASDRLRWSDNAAAVLGVADLKAFATGAAYDAATLDDTSGGRRAAIFQGGSWDGGNGMMYRAIYSLQVPGGGAVRLEDIGCWFDDGRGRPVRACGTLRRLSEVEKLPAEPQERDQQTGLLARDRFMALFETQIAAAAESGREGCLLALSIDALGLINEAYGLAAGDSMILEVVDRLRGSLRGGDLVARVSGNTFAVVLRSCAAREVEDAAARLVRAVSGKPISLGGHLMAAAVSVGAVAFPTHAGSAREAVSRAAEMLRQIRGKGFGRFRIWTPSAGRVDRRRKAISVADETLRGLAQDRIELGYQVVLGADTGTPLFHEALARLRCSDGTLLSGAEVVPAAEQLGYVPMLDRRALQLALAMLAERRDVVLSVNISPRTLADPSWVARFKTDLLDARALAPRLIVEITEGAVIEDLDQLRDLTTWLRTVGVRIALDDFGAGYTSFATLRALDLDYVKIDGAFVRRAPTDREDLAFVRALVELAKVRGVATVAEWIEDDATARLMRGLGVDALQGFLFGAPSSELPVPAG